MINVRFMDSVGILGYVVTMILLPYVDVLHRISSWSIRRILGKVVREKWSFKIALGR